MDTETSTQEEYAHSDVQQPSQSTGEDCNIISPTLADILSDDRILRFYQCVKDIKTQASPKQTASMFFALCHALGDTVSFLKVPNMPKIMFRQDHQIFAANVAGTQQDTVQIFQNTNNPTPTQQSAVQLDIAGNTAELMQQEQTAHSSPNLFSAEADSAPQHLLQAALTSVTSHVESTPLVDTPTPLAPSTKRKYQHKDGTPKRTKKASPRDKEFAVRRNEIIQDLLKVSEADLAHQANIVDSDTKLVIQGHERSTKIGMLPSPLERFSALANLTAHYDCDFAPKNAGVYYNFEYFLLYLAYRDVEQDRQQQQQMEGNSDSRPVLAQVRADIEKVLVSTNWEAIRRRLTIGERICQVCGVVGRGFLLLSKQVSGRKLLHNFNAGEWGEFMREFARPENQTLLQTLQAKYSPERFYSIDRQELMAIDMTSHNDHLNQDNDDTKAKSQETIQSSETANTPMNISTPDESILFTETVSNTHNALETLPAANAHPVDPSGNPDVAVAAVVHTPEITAPSSTDAPQEQ